ncbi:unnamed protein product [Sphagnum jensenii]|uniref:Transposase n=1 Tax=Sphagnum jensenii TaxID=128206 RepID=A0ABP0WS81_9BRYO
MIASVGLSLRMTKSRGMWQRSYPRTYGLEVTQQEGTHIKVARYRFCKYYGLQVPLNNRKRGPCKTDQFYTVPFRANLIVKHLEGQHADKWAEYVALSPGEQDTFFDSVHPRTNTMYHYMDMEADEINLVVSTKIVDVIIGEMLFCPEDELNAADDDNLAGIGNCNRNIEKLCRSALQLFKLNENKHSYTVNIKRVIALQARHPTRVVWLVVPTGRDDDRADQNTCKIAKLGGLNDTIVEQYVRILVGHALQVINNILANDNVWAFTISFDGSQHRGTTFFDVRIRVGMNGILHNLHLIAMLHFDRHTTANKEAILVKLLGALFTEWTRKLIDVTTDGEKTNMGHVNGVQQRQLLVLLANNIRNMFKVRHINGKADSTFDNLPIADYVRWDDSFVLLATLHEYVNDLRTRAQTHWLAIDTNEKTIARFAIGLLNDIAKVEVERDPANNAAVDLVACHADGLRQDAILDFHLQGDRAA